MVLSSTQYQVVRIVFRDEPPSRSVKILKLLLFRCSDVKGGSLDNARVAMPAFLNFSFSSLLNAAVKLVNIHDRFGL